MTAARVGNPMGRERKVAISLVLAVSFVRAQSAIPTPDQDPFVGQWHANAILSKPKLDKTEASYERIIRRDGAELIFSSTGGASKVPVRDFRIRCDGIPHMVPAGVPVSCWYVAPNRVEGEMRDSSTHFWAREVSSDGRKMSISSYRDKGRTKLISVIVLDRVN